AAARRRAGLRARIGVAALVRKYAKPEDRGPAFARVLVWGEEAAVALAALPEAAASPEADAALLAAAADGAHAEEFFNRLGRLWAQHRDGAPFDAAHAAPAELLARCLARAGDG
ncbi:MAG: hypothetical protein ACREFA_17605, partial [Stellaceae bacterium]